MPDKISKKAEEVYEFASLSKYSFKQRLTIRLADWIFYALIGLIGRTLRFETKGAENLESIEQIGKIPIYSLWHNRIFAGTFYLRKRKIVVITSQSFDGEYIARFLLRFGFGAVRGSSTRGGIGALIEMIRLMRQGLPMAFTVDGPKGPKYVAKSGAILLAKKTGNPILPFSVESEKFWTVKSWDNLQIPKPFSRAIFCYSNPIHVASDANEQEIEKKLEELQAKLDGLVKLGEQWRESITN
jgi:lysophospholipid acyltransferase (LPLAT)-like uncharacterized protein